MDDERNSAGLCVLAEGAIIVALVWFVMPWWILRMWATLRIKSLQSGGILAGCRNDFVRAFVCKV
jgi:hypothetical protein